MSIGASDLNLEDSGTLFLWLCNRFAYSPGAEGGPVSCPKSLEKTPSLFS